MRSRKRGRAARSAPSSGLPPRGGRSRYPCRSASARKESVAEREPPSCVILGQRREQREQPRGEDMTLGQRHDRVGGGGREKEPTSAALLGASPGERGGAAARARGRGCGGGGSARSGHGRPAPWRSPRPSHPATKAPEACISAQPPQVLKWAQGGRHAVGRGGDDLRHLDPVACDSRLPPPRPAGSAGTVKIGPGRDAVAAVAEIPPPLDGDGRVGHAEGIAGLKA